MMPKKLTSIVSETKLDFPTFLEILHEESLKNDPVVEIIEALQAMDPKKNGWITVPEFVSILTSVGEKMSREEVYNVLQQLDITGGRLTFNNLLAFISSPFTMPLGRHNFNYS